MREREGNMKSDHLLKENLGDLISKILKALIQWHYLLESKEVQQVKIHPTLQFQQLGINDSMCKQI